MILGITGTDGAGKGSVVEYLVKEKGFAYYSSSGFITEEIERQGLVVTRNQMRLTANELRAKHGNDMVVRQAFSRAQLEKKEFVVIESIRAIAEAFYLKGQGGVLLGVDADEHIRYERVQQRRSSKDQVSFEQFVEQETLEKNDPDPHGMQKAAVMEMADCTILNNSSLDELHVQIETFLEKYS